MVRRRRVAGARAPGACRPGSRRGSGRRDGRRAARPRTGEAGDRLRRRQAARRTGQGDRSAYRKARQPRPRRRAGGRRSALRRGRGGPGRSAEGRWREGPPRQPRLPDGGSLGRTGRPAGDRCRLRRQRRRAVPSPGPLRGRRRRGTGPPRGRNRCFHGRRGHRGDRVGHQLRRRLGDQPGALSAGRPGGPRSLRRAGGGGDDRRPLRLLRHGDRIDRRRARRHPRPPGRRNQRPARSGRQLPRPEGARERARRGTERRDRRGSGDAAGDPRPGAARRARLRDRLLDRTAVRRKHQAARRARRRRGGRGERDRRRRRLLRRALLPGRPGRRGDSRSHRSGGHLPHRGGQRQPHRSRDRQRDRLLGSARIPAGRMPGSGGHGPRRNVERVHELRPRGHRLQLRHDGRTRRRSADRPAVDGTVARGRSRPRRLPAQRRRPDHQRIRKRGRGPGQHRNAGSGGDPRLGKRILHPGRSLPGHPSLLRPLQPGSERHGGAGPQVRHRRQRPRRDRDRVPGIGGRGHRRPDDLRPRRLGRGYHPRGGQLGPGRGTGRTGALLLARPGDPLLRPGRKHQCGRRTPRTGSGRKAEPDRHRLRLDHVLRAAQRRRLLLLRDLGGGPARRRGGGPDAAGQRRRDAGGHRRSDGVLGDRIHAGQLARRGRRRAAGRGGGDDRGRRLDGPRPPDHAGRTRRTKTKNRKNPKNRKKNPRRRRRRRPPRRRPRFRRPRPPPIPERRPW